MRILALYMGKIIFSILHILGRRGAALPGLVVEKVFPRFLADSLTLLPEGVVIVTGTNGKTTSTKMLTHVLGSEKRVLTNPTGSNFVRGIVASIIQHSSWSGKLVYDIGVFELDEAYAVQFVQQYKPRAVVVLNVMRDQMDRFGEIDHAARLLDKVVKNATDFVVLNGDDERVASMKNHTKADVYYFGVSHKLRDIFRTDDELHQDVVGSKKRVKVQAELKEFSAQNVATIELAANVLAIPLAARGTYNAQNATAIVLAAHLLKTPVDIITTRISEVLPAFGRGEHIQIGEKTVILQLVKNPGGFRHALLMGETIKPETTMVAINDDYPDGRDVSWLWDVAFTKGVHGRVVTSGVRAADMALRLKYDDIATQSVIPDLSNALTFVLKGNRTVLIYTTYTAMLELRKLLAQITEVERV